MFWERQGKGRRAGIVRNGHLVIQKCIHLEEWSDVTQLGWGRVFRYPGNQIPVLVSATLLPALGRCVPCFHAQNVALAGTWPGRALLGTESCSQRTLRPKVTKTFISLLLFLISSYYWVQDFLTSLNFSRNFQTPSPSLTMASTFLGLPESRCAISRSSGSMKSSQL